MKCSKCGNELPDNALFCPTCGTKRDELEGKNTNPNTLITEKKVIPQWLIIALAVIALVIVLAIIKLPSMLSKPDNPNEISEPVNNQLSESAVPDTYSAETGIESSEESPQAKSFPLELKQWDLVELGTYPQTSDEPEPLTWEVFGTTDSYYFLWTEYIIDCQPYMDIPANDNAEHPTFYDDTYIAKWLKGTFYENTFTAEEKQYITDPINGYNNSFTYPVRLFDYRMIEAFFPEYFKREATKYENFFDYYDTDMICSPTPYAIRQGVVPKGTTLKVSPGCAEKYLEKAAPWLMSRNYGYPEPMVTTVSQTGWTGTYSYFFWDNVGIRPVIVLQR